MKQFFFALAFCDSMLVAATGALGFFVADRLDTMFRLHFAAGLVTALMLIFTHVAVFTYFIVTGKLIMRAGASERVAADAAVVAGGLKARAIRFAVPGIASIVIVTTTGALAHQTPALAMIHFLAFFLTITLNMFALAGEYACIDQNTRLLDATLADYAGRDDAEGPRADGSSGNALASSRFQRYEHRLVRGSAADGAGPPGG